MKCVNCGGTEFEKAARDGIFTLQYQDRFGSGVEVPRYFYACLDCGFVVQILDLEARENMLEGLVEEIIIDALGGNRFGESEENKISLREIQKITKLPLVLLQSILDDYLHMHPGFMSFGSRIVAVLKKEDGEMWIVRKRP